MDKKTGKDVGGQGGGSSASSNSAMYGPPCYGHLIRRSLDDKCMACEWMASCHYYSYSRGGEKSREVHFRDFQEVPFDKKRGLEVERAMEKAYEARQGSFLLPDGSKVDISGVNVNLMKICIWLTVAFPDTMRAFALKLDPRVRSLEDMAAILHTSRQLLHKHIARECGVGSVPGRGKRALKPIGADAQQEHEQKSESKQDGDGNGRADGK